MKIKNIKRLSLLLILPVIMMACYDDKGNYDYLPINDVTFENFDEEYTVKLGSRITIKPEVVQTRSQAGEEFDFLWLKMGTGMSYTSFDTVHREKYMDDIVPLLPAGKNKMVYQAINRSNGVKYTSDYFYINVNNDIETGFTLLHEVDGGTALNYLNYVDSYFELREIDLSGMPELGKPLKINNFPDMNSPILGSGTGGYAVNLLTETGLYRLLYSDFSYKDTYNARYVIFGETGPEFRITDMTPSRSKYFRNMMIRDQDGNFMYYERLHNKAIMWTIGAYCNSYLNNDGTMSLFNVSDVHGYDRGTAMFFDLDSRSIVYKNAGMNYSERFVDEPGDVFKLNNVNYEPLFITCIHYRSNPATHLFAAVVREANGTISTFQWNAYSMTKELNSYQSLAGLEKIEDAKMFSMPFIRENEEVTNYLAYLYYATDNAIYLRHPLGTNTKVYTAPAGQTIVKMDVMVPTFAEDGSKINPFAYHLAVATNGTGENSSTFEVYEIRPTYGTLTLATTAPDHDPDSGEPEPEEQEMRWTGLPKIVDFDWKNR